MPLFFVESDHTYFDHFNLILRAFYPVGVWHGVLRAKYSYFVIDYDGEGATYNMLDLHHPKGQNSLQSWSITYKKVFLQDDHKNLLGASGFKDIRFYGDYDFSAYDKQTSNRLISTAVKDQ